MENVSLRVNSIIKDELEQYLALNNLPYGIKNEGKGVFEFILPSDTEIPSLPHKGVFPSLH